MTVTKTDLHEWRQVVESCEWATFYERPDWYEAWCAHMGNRVVPECWKIQIEGSRYILIPVLRKNALKGMTSTYTGAPGGLYSGPISNHAIMMSEVQQSVQTLAGKLKNLDVRLNPFWFHANQPDHLPDSWGLAHFTQAIHLCQSDESLSGVLTNTGVSYDARYAERKGVDIQITDMNDLTNFMDLYAEMLQKWESVGTIYTSRFFESLVSSPHVDFWKITHKSEYVGGGLLLKGKYHVSSWLTIIHPEVLKLRPYEYTYAHLIGHYRKLGFTWFDFNPSAGLDGVVRFKEKFGTQILPFPEYSKYSGIISLANLIRGVS